MISIGLIDEIFVAREYSLSINISSLIEAINTHKIKFDRTSLAVSDLEVFIKSDNLNNEYLYKLSHTRRDEPIIITFFENLPRIIDGNHRLLKRKNDGFSECNVIYISQEELSPYCEELGF